MRIVWRNDRFEVEGRDTYDNRETLKNYGFRWDPTQKAWYCPGESQRLSGLRQFKPTITPEAKTKYDEFESTRQASLEASRSVDASIDIPCNPTLAYLPYQRGGIAYAIAHPNTLFGDEMGLGKTIQAIGTYNADQEARTCLVICPASLKLNWRKELLKWSTKPIRIHVVKSGTKPLPPAVSIEVLIINYEMLRKFRAELRSFTWDVMIIDEAHYLKNKKTGRTVEVFGQTKWTDPRTITPECPEGITRPEIKPIPAKRKLVLTGTPLVNRTKELWTIIKALDPGFERDERIFQIKYCGAYQGQYGWVSDGAGTPEQLADLQERMRSRFMVRRLKKDVLKELPPKRRQVVVLEPSAGIKGILAKEKQAYDAYAQSIKGQEFETPDFGEMSAIRQQVALAKVPFISDYVREALESVDKVCVFVHHYEVVDALRDTFGDSAVVIDGRIAKVEDRQAAVDRFQTDPTCKVFIGTIRAAGVGITLTASSTVIFGELDWVPGNVSQAEDRCHRIGQLDGVNVYHLVLEGSLDERMAQIIIDKQEIIDQTLDITAAKVVEEFTVSQAAPQGATTPGPFNLETATTQVNGGEKYLPSARPAKAQTEAGASGNGVPVRPASTEFKKSFTKEQEQAVLTGLRMLAGVCDGAQDLDNCGFNKFDSRFGKDLAARAYLSEKQFKCGFRMVQFYRRQLPADLIKIAKGEV